MAKSVTVNILAIGYWYLGLNLIKKVRDASLLLLIINQYIFLLQNLEVRKIQI